jgi:hypothetical protein
VATCDYCTVEASASGIAAVCSKWVAWRVHAGAILVQRWDGGRKLLIGTKANDGKIIKLQCGKIVEEWTGANP